MDKTSETQIASDNASKIFILSKNGNVKTFDWLSGEQFWNTDTGIINISKLSLDYENLYLKGNINRSLRIETGLVNSLDNTSRDFAANDLVIKNLGNNSEDENIILKTEIGIISGDKKGFISLRSSQLDKNIWKYKTGGKITSIKNFDNNLIVTSFDNFVYMIALSDGEIIWKKRLIGRIKEEPIIFENYLFVTVIGENTGFLLNLNQGRIISTITLKSNTNFVKALYASTNTVLFETSEGIAFFSRIGCAELKTAFHRINEKPSL